MSAENGPDLSGRTALITGASRGIGRAIALACARAGAHVVAVARTVGALEELDDTIRSETGAAATLIPLDLRDADKIDTIGPALAQKFGRLDILVANAGMLGTLGPLPHADAREWQRVMDVNCNANFRLIRTLDPLLRAAPAGRAVFVSSGLAHKPLAYWGAYCASKAALDMMIRVYAAETEKTTLRVNLLDPGIVDTTMLAQAFPGGYQGPTRKPEDIVPACLALLSPSCTRHGETACVD